LLPEEKGDYIYTHAMWVKDTGNSFSKEQRRKLFSLFYPEKFSKHEEFPGWRKPTVH